MEHTTFKTNDIAFVLCLLYHAHCEVSLVDDVVAMPFPDKLSTFEMVHTTLALNVLNYTHLACIANKAVQQVTMSNDLSKEIYVTHSIILSCFNSMRLSDTPVGWPINLLWWTTV